MDTPLDMASGAATLPFPQNRPSHFYLAVKGFFSNAYSTTADPPRQGSHQDAHRVPCAPFVPAKARRVPARVHDHSEEAELGASQGVSRAPHEQHGSDQLHPG